jgi:hypothetical protein
MRNGGFHGGNKRRVSTSSTVRFIYDERTKYGAIMFQHFKDISTNYDRYRYVSDEQFSLQGHIHEL